jgi:signal transduction histidine kinase
MESDPVELRQLIEQLALAESQLGHVPDTPSAVTIILQAAVTILPARAALLVVADPAGTPLDFYSQPPGLAGGPEAISALLRVMHSTPGTATSDPHRIDAEAAAALLSALEIPVEAVPAAYALRLVLRTGLLGYIVFLLQNDRLDRAVLPRMALLAGRAATALEVARLHDSAVQQATELGMFYETAAAVGSRGAVPGLLEQILARAVRVTPYEAAAIYLVEPKHAGLTPAAALGVANGYAPLPTFRLGEGAPGWVAATGETLRIESPPMSGDIVQQAFGMGEMKRFLAVPMIWQQEVIGVLVLASCAEPFAFGDADLRLARIVAYQAASALGIARLIEAEREQRSLAEALELASLSISQRLDLDSVLDGILDQVMRVFPCDAANFQTLHGERSQITKARGYEAFGLSYEFLQAATLTTTGHATLARMLDGRAMVVEDTQLDPAWVNQSGLDWIRSWAGAPLRFGNTLLGFINLDSARPGAFDAETERRLAAFAAHAASAIHNARTYQDLQVQHQRLEQVHRIGNAIAGTLSPEQIEHELVLGLRSAVPAIHIAAYRCERAGQMVASSAFTHAEPFPERTAAWSRGSDLAVQSIEAGKVLQHREASDGVPVTVLTIPFAAAERTYGAIALWMEPDALIDDPLLDALAAIGQQAGLALANADRHAQVQRRLAEMTLLQNVVGAVARRLEVDAVLTEVTEQLHTSLGFPAVQFFLRQGDEVVLTRVSGPHPVAHRGQLDRGIVGRVVRTGRPAYVPDVRVDPDYLAALVGTRAEVCVPVLQGNEVIGAINVETSDPEQFDPGVLELLGMLADQMSIALHNATLYEQIRTDVTTLEARVRERTLQLEEALERAQEAERAKSLFVADVSHELRTPLTNIGLYLDLLEIGSEERRSDYMATLRRETERLGTLIEQLLTISNLDAQQSSLNLRAVDLNELTQVLLGDRERLILSRGLVLETSLQPDLPPVLADPRLLMQVMTNLLSNAAQYTPSGGKILIRTTAAERDGSAFAAFSVRDTGPGVPRGEQERIFDRFFRGTTGRSSGAAGTGLGLAIAREVMGQHHGEITLSSEPGQGAEFTAWIPIAEIS